MSGNTFLVLRPDPQGSKLCHLITALGDESIFLPTILINPLTSQFIDKNIQQIKQATIVIFNSPNAVYHSIEKIHRYYPQWPAMTKIAAIGEGTASALYDVHLTAHITPATDFSSEALLKMPELQQVADRQIILIKGLDGNTLLANTLHQRHADVLEIQVYERLLPHYSQEKISSILAKNITAIIAASDETLINLWKLVNDEHKKILRRIPLVIVSEKMRRTAEYFGFLTTLFMPDARNETIITALRGIRWN